jgi:hypothetical protein
LILEGIVAGGDVKERSSAIGKSRRGRREAGAYVALEAGMVGRRRRADCQNQRDRGWFCFLGEEDEMRVKGKLTVYMATRC